MPTFKVAGERFFLDRESVERALDTVLPEPLREHYVVISARRFPPKQVLSVLTGLDRADFTTHQARRILKRLGFVAARRTANAEAPARPLADPTRAPYAGRQAAALAPYVGKWVALGEPDEILVAADTVSEVLAWLMRHDKKASGVLRVPRSRAEAELLGPV